MNIKIKSRDIRKILPACPALQLGGQGIDGRDSPNDFPHMIGHYGWVNSSYNKADASLEAKLFRNDRSHIHSR
jgi:hypothetical protein